MDDSISGIIPETGIRFSFSMKDFKAAAYSQQGDELLRLINSESIIFFILLGILIPLKGSLLSLFYL